MTEGLSYTATPFSQTVRFSISTQPFITAATSNHQLALESQGHSCLQHSREQKSNLAFRKGSPRNIIGQTIILSRLTMCVATSSFLLTQTTMGEQNLNVSLTEVTKTPMQLNVLEAQGFFPLSLSLPLLLSFNSLLKEIIPSE